MDAKAEVLSPNQECHSSLVGWGSSEWLIIRGEFQACILNESIGWRTALHNQQTPTPADPTGLPAGSGQTCRTNPMSGQNTSSYKRTSSRAATERKGESGKGGGCSKER
ncbi:unnamed protein product [Pleuronectes platessa]|uniref:Uncharacterized protein n=1 Tax=Pleuronectes platessa TaxID=8262 RepID=A0A9N7VGC3_PLEPL|nr:unnamed protein product [Pleuronectes platessa]